MAFSTLLEIIDRACDEMGLSRPAAVIGNTDPQTIQLLSYANAAGKDLLEGHDWSVLQTLGTITTANGTATYALASDYDRMLQDTMWNRTSTWQLEGPDSPQLNRALIEGIPVGGARKRFRITGTSVVITPTPTATETIVYEYVSNKWARSSGSVAQDEFAADTDTSVFSPALMKAEIKWRYMAGKGLYADALKAEADDMRARRIAADLGGTILRLEPSRPTELITVDNVPEGSWSL